MRRGVSFVFARQRGRSNLSNHEAGIEAGLRSEKRGKQTGVRVGHVLDAALADATESGQRDGELVGGHG